METKLNDQVWLQNFELAAANCPTLKEDEVEEIRETLIQAWLTLSLDDVAEEEISERLVELTDKLLTRHQSSVEQANELVARLANPVRHSDVSKSTFPVSETNCLPVVLEPLQRIESLVAELRSHGEYLRIRDEYCQLSILLNLQGRFAPAFRPALVTGKKYGDSVFKAIHRDQLVIDCHWLQATQRFVKVRAKDVEFAQMFNFAKPFPFELAWGFANKVWTANHRATDMLRLTEFQQCQMAALRSDVVKERIQRIEQGSRKDGRFYPSPQAIFEQGLNAWCERDRRVVKYREGYVAVWKARALLGDAASVRQVGALAAMMLGETAKDDKTTRGKEEKIIRHILGE